MISIWVETTDGDSFKTNCQTVPRIGETVAISGIMLKVIDVIHELSSSYNDGRITIFLDQVN